MSSGGVLYAFGKISNSAGTSQTLIPVKGGVDSAGDCPFPSEVDFGKNSPRIVKVSADCGTFGCIDVQGNVWGWSTRSYEEVTTEPKMVYTTTDDTTAISIATGYGFIVVILSTGSCLILGKLPKPLTKKIFEPPSGSFVSCDASQEGILLLNSECCLYQLGTSVAFKKSCDIPTAVPTLPSRVVSFSIGSVHCAASLSDGSVMCWGDGESGCLGTGIRKLTTTPTTAELPENVISVSCTKGQQRANRTGKKSGQEGPRTHAITKTGSLWIAGSTHKGLGADHINKILFPDSDHVKFYKVGGKAADKHITDKVPTGAAEELKHNSKAACNRMGMTDEEFGCEGFTNYLKDVAIVQTGAAHIHSAAVSSDGRLFSWGCGSNGRTGLMAFMRGPGGSKRTMKCYVSTPTAVEKFDDMSVLSMAIGKYWTLAIANPRDGSLRKSSSTRRKTSAGF